MKFWSSPDDLLPSLRNGAVVVLPTDTVMGLVGRPTPKTVETIYKIKGRAPSKPLILFQHRDRFLERSTNPPCAQKLAEKFWPGPLTLVVPAQSEDPAPLLHHGTIGIRHPAPPFPQKLLEVFPEGLASTSANRSGFPPAVHPDEIDPDIQKWVEGILSLPAGGQKPSTLIRCTQPPCLLRSGPIGLPEAEAVIQERLRWCVPRPLRVLIVCTGNTCRSPLAHAFLLHEIHKRDLNVEVTSAGTHAMEGAPIAPEVYQVLAEHGISFHHRSQHLTPERIEWADLILAMAQEHQRILQDLGAGGKTLPFAPYDMPDPIGLPLSQYRWVGNLIRKEIDRWTKDLLNRPG